MAGLDAEELLHIGLYASQADDPAQAIAVLKQCLALEPSNAKATYLLGALYAQIGLYDRAKETLATCVDLEPEQTTAVFQLGLLHLTSGDIAAARQAWDRLDALPATHCFNLFRQGLLALVEDRFTDCVALLTQGIAANQMNDALNQDMQRVRQSAESAGVGSGAAVLTSEPISVAPQTQHILGSYRRQNRH